jgi:formate hydrogenlyase subunit 6/NADH:ubiquinone oxidoreductase subunit I
MFRILAVIAGNVLHGPGTVRLPDSVPCPPNFRGAVTHDPALCLACGICSYVCVGDAITAAEQDKNYVWTYEPGRCTFCARCVDHCPGLALTMAAGPVAAYFKPGELSVQHLAPVPACPQCGEPSRPVNEALLGRAFDEVNPEIRLLARLCERCRQQLQSKQFLATNIDDEAQIRTDQEQTGQKRTDHGRKGEAE